MTVFPIGIKHPLNVAVQRSHNPDAREPDQEHRSTTAQRSNEAVRDGLMLGPLRPAGSEDQCGVPKATE